MLAQVGPASVEAPLPATGEPLARGASAQPVVAPAAAAEPPHEEAEVPVPPPAAAEPPSEPAPAKRARAKPGKPGKPRPKRLAKKAPAKTKARKGKPRGK